MAASWRSSSSGIAGIGKRVASQIWTSNAPLPPPPSVLRRATHASSYDKNPEDHSPATVVPDELIQLQSDKYWGPDPKTGVFGPATDPHFRVHGEASQSSTGDAESSSVLEHKAWFRPTSLEDQEKPIQL